MDNLKRKKILVIGLARSGQAAVRFLTGQGAVVTGTDIKGEGELGAELRALKILPARFILGKHPRVGPGIWDLVITSPGVPSSITPVQDALRYGIPVWSELELAGRFIRQPVIAVTGTNGKTTTTSLIGYIFQQAGFNAVVAGNIGIPLIQEVQRKQQEKNHVRYWIVEVSSFQLEHVQRFRPKIAVLLNITPDHIDRHGSPEEYGRVKTRIFRNQCAGDYVVLNHDDPWITQNVKSLRSQVYWFSRHGAPEIGTGVRDRMIVFRDGQHEEILCPVAKVGIPGPHNLENILAATTVSLLAGIKRNVVVASLASFPGVAHRLESVGVVNGVKYINDSKGTNPESVIKALDSFQEPIILIAGGRHKGSDLEALARKIKERVKALILLGEAAPLLEDVVSQTGFQEIWNVATLEDGVRTAAQLAHPGDVVLLSPACASWDMFRDYEERGDLFRQLVNEL